MEHPLDLFFALSYHADVICICQNLYFSSIAELISAIHLSMCGKTPSRTKLKRRGLRGAALLDALSQLDLVI